MKLGFACALIMLLGIAAGCRTRQKPAVAVFERPYETSYHFPLTSPGAKFATLPPAVQHSIRAETGGAEIDEIVIDTNSAPKVYRVYFVNYEAYPPLYLAADGSVLNQDLSVAMGGVREQPQVITGGPTQAVTLNDLPPVVVKEVQRLAPDSEIESITKESRGQESVYFVTFKGRTHTPLRIASDGTLLRR